MFLTPASTALLARHPLNQATVDQVRSSRFTNSSQQKFALKDRVLPVRQFAVR